MSDYINTMSLYTKNRKTILKEVQKYTQLVDLYSDLENGVLYEDLPKDQVLLSFLYLNPSFFYPVSSYVYPKKYSQQEGSKLKGEEMVSLENEDYESILNELKEQTTIQQRLSFVENLLYILHIL